MKRVHLIIIYIISTILLTSCATSKQARVFKKTVDGNWQLQTIVTESITGKIKIQVFNEADFNCFIGSSWTFNEHDKLGSYNISKNANECDAIKRNIRWAIYEATADQPKLLQFKKLDDKMTEIDDGGGYRFIIVQLDDKNMQLRSDLTIEGKRASFTYNFVRN